MVDDDYYSSTGMLTTAYLGYKGIRIYDDKVVIMKDMYSGEEKIRYNASACMGKDVIVSTKYNETRKSLEIIFKVETSNFTLTKNEVLVK